MHYRVVFVALLLAVSVPAGAVGVGAAGSALDTDESPTVSPGDGPHSIEGLASASTDVLAAETTLRHVPDNETIYEAETRFGVPDSVTDLEIELESEATVRSAAGFEPTGDGIYRWTGETDEPAVRTTMPADRTGYRSTTDESAASVGGDEPAEGYSFVDTGDWAIVPVPQVRIGAQSTEALGIESTATVEGSGATGGDIAVFGDVTEYERPVDGERLRLAVPAAADLQEAPDDVLEALAAGSEHLAVGERPDETFVVAAPTGVDWGPRGLQYGEADAWVRADASLSEPDNVWLHEYVHVRQGFAGSAGATAADAEWLVEAQAEYHAALIALEKGLIEFHEFERFLERGERSPYADGVLAEPASWDDPHTDYVQGPLVYGELDRQLRLATDGDRTLADVFRTLNVRAADGPIAEADFLAALEDAGGESVRETAMQYAGTESVPSMWDRNDHEAAFERSSPTIEYGYAADAPLEVAGEPWKRWESTGDAPVTAVPADEPVVVPVAIENAGDREGSYDATLQVDGTVVDRVDGTLAAGDRTDARLEWTPPEPGAYELRVGSETLTAIVRAPSSVAVADLSVDPDDIEPGESATATATLEAADDRPAAAVVAVRTPDGIAAEKPVVVRPGERATIEQSVAFDEDGYHEIAVGDRGEMVSVGTPPLADLETVPGFGLGATLASIAALIGSVVAITALRSRRR